MMICESSYRVETLSFSNFVGDAVMRLRFFAHHVKMLTLQKACLLPCLPEPF